MINIKAIISDVLFFKWSENTPYARARYSLIFSTLVCLLMALTLNPGFLLAAMLLPLVSLGIANSQTDIFEMGKQAHASGNPISSCPFDEKAWSKAEWINGWKWAEQNEEN